MDNSSGCAPALSIVITTWNRAHMVIAAIESILAQDCPECLEVVVLNDGSTDETLSTLYGLQQHPLPPNRMLRVVRGDHQGRSGAAQRGIDAVTAACVALLSSDDRWEPQRAHELLAEERRLGGDALIHTDWKEIDRSGRPIHGGQGARPPHQRAPFEYTRASDGEGILRQYVTSALRRHCFASCASVFPRRLLRGDKCFACRHGHPICVDSPGNAPPMQSRLSGRQFTPSNGTCHTATQACRSEPLARTGRRTGSYARCHRPAAGARCARRTVDDRRHAGKTAPLGAQRSVLATMPSGAADRDGDLPTPPCMKKVQYG